MNLNNSHNEQKIFLRVQELISDDQRESGRIPRTIECELSQDLVDSCVPGDMVTITGVIKVSNEEGWYLRAVRRAVCAVRNVEQ